MRSKNFFDRFNDELGNAVLIAQIGFVVIGATIVLAIGAAGFWLLR